MFCNPGTYPFAEMRSCPARHAAIAGAFGFPYVAGGLIAVGGVAMGAMMALVALNVAIIGVLLLRGRKG